MNIPVRPTADQAPRSAQKLSHKRTVTVVTTFILTTAFALAGAPAAAAAPAPLNNHMYTGGCRISPTRWDWDCPPKPAHRDRPSWPCEDNPGIDCEDPW